MTTTKEKLQEEYEKLCSSGVLHEIASARNTNQDMMGRGVTITNDARTFNLFDFKPEDISIYAIARSLSNQCRYNGSTSYFYSVAQHSVRMAETAYLGYGDVNLAFATLLHDAVECYVSDIPYTLKREFPDDVRDIEKNIERVIFDHFGISEYYDSRLIKYLDTQICNDEIEFLLNNRNGIKSYVDDILCREISHEEILRGGIGSGYPTVVYTFDSWSPEKSYEMFISAFFKYSYLKKRYGSAEILTQFGVNTEKE